MSTATEDILYDQDRDLMMSWKVSEVQVATEENEGRRL